MRIVVCVLLFGICASMSAQTTSKTFRTRTIQVDNSQIKIDSVSISPNGFKITDGQGKPLNTLEYTIDFAKALLTLHNRNYTKITIEYYVFPEFLTKSYSLFDPAIIVPRRTSDSKLYSAIPQRKSRFLKPFDGLTTSGSISRGFTVGNNQDAVLNSNLDLQIAGYLSDRVQLRASITDTNIPLQEGGFTQRLNEFDRVFIELFSDDWSIKAGDINLINTDDYFLKFNKKVAGVAVNAELSHMEGATKAFASGAIVRGQFARNTIVAQEANQGPYKINGNSNEQILLMISGSETVFVNGRPLKRGENNDYIIDYNTAELTFNPTFPVNANMRIIVEYQFSDRNYTRFVTYNGAQYTNEALKIAVKFYNESDAKNQTIQQDLTDSQRLILANAGDDRSQMIVPSALPQAFAENSIQYRKDLVNGEEVFVFSNQATDDLFNVQFSFVGIGQGNYQIQTTLATGRVYEYIAPVNGIPQGDYEPLVQLVAPERLQIASLNAQYVPSDKTNLIAELAYSAKDLNLFSSIDDSDNQGIATRINWDQRLVDKKWKLNTRTSFELIDRNFSTIERFRNIEFARDWDLVNPQGNQRFIRSQLAMQKDSLYQINYTYENLHFSENFDGTRHTVLARVQDSTTLIAAQGSFLKNDNVSSNTEFLRFYSLASQSFNKKWTGIRFNTEYNNRINTTDNSPSVLNHKFIDYEAFAGVGDSTKVFVQLGYNFRTTDSVRLGSLQRVNTSRTYYLRSKIVATKNTDLSIFASYRDVRNEFSNNEEILNARLLYRQQFFDNGISLNTIYETNSGSLPQQEFSYVEVAPGQGFYTWNDYNDNGIQELDEFEVAQFPDEAIYVRIALPTTRFIRTHRNKFSQALTLNASRWRSASGFKKFLSHFINQSFVLIDTKNERENNSYNLNPFDIQDPLALSLNLKNNLYFNRGKQHYSMIYTYLDTRSTAAFSFGDQENNLKSHQLQFIHKIGRFWLIDVTGSTSKNQSASTSFGNRNFLIQRETLNPKLAYIYSKNSRFELFYTFNNKENQQASFESLRSHNLGANLFIAKGQRLSVNANTTVFFNDFEGNQNSPVAFQMLEGLLPGTNYTWTLNFQHKLTSYLDINVNYLGRKSPATNAVHTGTIQLRATF